MRDVNKKGESDRFELFAAKPPLEAKRMFFRTAAKKNQEHPEDKYKLLFVDVKKARLTGKMKECEWVFVLMPAEAGGRVGGGVVRVRMWLRWMRPAAKAWQEDCASNLCAEVYVAE